jgi:hypothetical protein
MYANAVLYPPHEEPDDLDLHIDAVYDNLLAEGFVEEAVVHELGLCAIRWWEITGGTPTPDHLTAVEAVENLIRPAQRERAAEAVRKLLEELARKYGPDNVVMVRTPSEVVQAHVVDTGSHTYSPDTMAIMFRPDAPPTT